MGLYNMLYMYIYIYQDFLHVYERKTNGNMSRVCNISVNVFILHERMCVCACLYYSKYTFI